ncbi:secretin N-terminal domain-containing protein [Escherichia coli]|nr:secretin N-terminal domain-containing protein [Escherichia coli]
MRCIILILLLFLSSCTTKQYQRSERNINNSMNDTNKALSRAKNEKAKIDTSNIQISKGIYLANQSTKNIHGDPLPARFETNQGFTLVSGIPLKLDNILKLISDATGIPTIKAKVTDPLFQNPTGTMSAEKVSQTLSKAVGDGGNTNDSFFDSLVNYTVDAHLMDVNYKGALSEFLDKVSANYDIVWKYRDGKLQFLSEDVRTFNIATLPSKITANNSVGGSGSGGSGSAGSSSGGGSGGNSSGSGGSSNGSQSLNIDLTLDFWQDLEKNLKIIIGNRGTFNISTSTSSVVVQTTPFNMERVADYIDNLNKELIRQVTVNVVVYSVNTTDSNNLALSLKGALSSGGKVLGALSSEFAVANSPTLSGFINGDQDTNNSVIMNLLASAGKVSIVTSASVTTMSGQPVPLQVGNDRTYVSEIGTTLGQTASTSTVSTSSISSGFAMNLLPRVMENGNVLLQYGINISSLAGSNNGFESVTVSGTTIQLPNVDQRTFVQSSLLKNGSTLVLAGYEQQRDETADQGIGRPEFKLLGGGKRSTNERNVIVICITPTVIDVDKG